MTGRLLFYLIVGVLAVVTLYGVYKAIWNAGWNARNADFELFKKNQQVRTVEVIKEVEKVVVKVETEVVERIREVKVKGDTIVKEVPVYVTKVDDAACELRNGFVRSHDAAARNEPSGPAQDTDRDPAGVELSQALQAVADNYAKYHACREKVIGWNRFWDEYSQKIRGAVCLARE